MEEAAPTSEASWLRGEEVVLQVKKHALKYGEKRAKIIRCNKGSVVVELLEGSCKGEQKKMPYANLKKQNAAAASGLEAATVAQSSGGTGTGSSRDDGFIVQDGKDDDDTGKVYGDLEEF